MSESSNPIKAAIWVFGAISSFSAMAIAGRELGSSLDTFEIMFYRSLVGIIIVLMISKWFNLFHQVKLDRLGLHFTRNVAHFIGQNLWFFAMTGIPLSQLFAFEFSTPVWVALMAPIFLKEKLTPIRGISALLGFIGILFVARPDFSNLPPHIIAAFLCAVGFAGSVIATKLLTRTQSILCILFWLVVMQAVFGLICAGYDGEIVVPRGHQISLLIVIGVCGLLAHYCLTKAMSLAPAIVVAPLDFLRLPMIAIVAYLLYGEILEWPVLVGAIIVFAANILNIRSELKQRRAIA